jgi:hypothetical protein
VYLDESGVGGRVDLNDLGFVIARVRGRVRDSSGNERGVAWEQPIVSAIDPNEHVSANYEVHVLAIRVEVVRTGRCTRANVVDVKVDGDRSDGRIDDVLNHAAAIPKGSFATVGKANDPRESAH